MMRCLLTTTISAILVGCATPEHCEVYCIVCAGTTIECDQKPEDKKGPADESTGPVAVSS